MTLLEFAEKNSPFPLTEWQREYFNMYEESLKTGKKLTVLFPPRSGRQHTINIINQYYGNDGVDISSESMKKCAEEHGVKLDENSSVALKHSIRNQLIHQHCNENQVTVYCQGIKKNGIPCKRYLGKVEGKAELLCPICKTLNVVENDKITIKEKRNV